MIKPDYFELIFRNWVKRVCLEVKGVVAIDGKLMRGPSQCDGAIYDYSRAEPHYGSLGGRHFTNFGRNSSENP